MGICAIAIVALTSGTLWAQTPMMGVSELSRGMRGTGRTVFHGTQIDTFGVEILGVLRNTFGPKTDIILAKLSGATLEKTGGIAGMSGSPVYVEGKLIGAVAYGWSFSIEPIMGITPIAEMVEIMDRKDLAAVDERPIRVRESREHEGPERIEVGDMQPVKTPVYMSGFVPEILPDLRDHLAEFGLMPVQGGGGEDQSLPEATLEPGAALGVQLVRGDFNMTAIGTLTYIDGDKLVGFGHPMFSSGATRLPMTTAFIHDVVASQFQSFKLGSAVRQVGAITQDRAPGIGGVIGARAEMMPTTITISSDRTRSFEMEVLRNRDFGPILLQSAVVSSLISSEKARGQATVQSKLRLKLSGYPEFSVSNVYAGARGLGEGVLGVTRPIQLLAQNPFEDVRIESADFELAVDNDVEAASIRSIQLDRSTFEPGDEVGVTVELSAYLKPNVTVKTSVRIPEYVRQGTLMLRVSSARAHAAQESKRTPDRFRVRDVGRLLQILEEENRNDELIVTLLANRAGATVDGVELSSLPASVVSAMKTSRRSGSIRPVNQSVIEEKQVSTSYVLSGQQTVSLNVGSPGAGIRFSPGPASPTPKKK